MQTLLSWIGYGISAVLFVACVVAWYEHLGRARRPQDEPDWESPLPKAMKIDVEIEPPSAGDQAARQVVLEDTISRMSSGDRRNGFGDTAPMILPGKAADAPPAERRRRDTTQAS